MHLDDIPQLYTMPEAAKLLRSSTRHVHGLARSGKLPALQEKPYAPKFVTREDLAAHLASIRLPRQRERVREPEPAPRQEPRVRERVRLPVS